MADPQVPVQEPGQLNAIPVDNYDIHKDLGRVIDRTGIVNAPTAPNLLYDSGTPYTIDGVSKINPMYSLYMSTLKNHPTNPITQPYLTNLPKTERYNENDWGGYQPFDTNLENWYGENQSWLKQWGNHLGKFAVKTVGSFANSLMDIPNTVNAISEGNIDKMWDNPSNTWAASLMEWSEKVMPNFKTNWETKHPFLNLIPIYGNSANSWGNIIEQTGFTVGAIGGAVVEDLAVGALTGGVGEIPLAAQQINKAVYNLGKLINAGGDSMDALKTTIKSADELIKGLKGIDRFNYAVRQGLWGANMITSGFAEAGFEGIESYKTLTKDLTQEFFDTTGTLPDYAQTKKIENTSKTAATARFNMNAALLALTNSIQWGSLIKPFNAAKEVIEAEAKSGIRVGLAEGSRDVFKMVEPTTRLARFGNALGRNKLVELLAGSSSEGFEEGAQFLIENGVNDYYKRKYHSPSIDFTNNFLKSFGTGLSKTLGTQEGWENIVGGLLGGALFKGGEHVYYKSKGAGSPTFGDYKKEVESVIQGLNNVSLSGIFENKYGEGVAATAIEKDLTDAIVNNNLFQYKNFKHEHFANFVLSGVKQNKFETRVAQLQELKKLSQDDFQKTFGIPFTDENRKTANEFVNELIGKATYIKEVNDRVSRTFTNPFNYKGTGNYKNVAEAQEQNKVNERYIAYEAVKEQLVYNMSVTKDSANRINDLRNEITGMDTRISPDLIANLSSADGLRDLKTQYRERIKTLQDSIKIAKDKKIQKELDWHLERLEDIDSILGETDEAKQTPTYNELLNEVLANQIRGLDRRKKAQIDPLLVKDMMVFGRDMFYLQKRNEVAIDSYAGLTTEGGFKKLFDRILALRAEVAAMNVPLTQETPQPKNPQQQAAFNNAQAQAGIAPTQQPQENETQGFETETVTQLTPDEQRQVNEVLIRVVDGKIQASSTELEDFLEFHSIDDLKFTDPNVDLTKYYKVKSSEGKNFYRLKSEVDAIRASMTAPVAGTPTKPVRPAPPTPPVTPANTGEGSGKEGLRVEDFVEKVFVPADLREAFSNAIFSAEAETVRKELSVTVAPLDATYQAEYDKQKKEGSYTPVVGYPGVYVSKSPIDVTLNFKGSAIGKMPFPERLLFDVNGKLLTIDKLTSQQYAQFTSRPAAQHGQDVDNYKKYVALKNYLALEFKVNGSKPVTITKSKFVDLVDIIVSYGELDLVAPTQNRPTFDQLKHTTITLKNKNGGSIQTQAIVSIPKRYINDTQTRERTDFTEIIFGQNYYEDIDTDVDVLSNLVNNSIADLHKLNSRYIGVVQLPNGNFKFIALRPARASTENLEEAFKSIMETAEGSVKDNFIETDDTENADGKLLIGDNILYYKLPSDAAKKRNDEFNSALNNRFYITDPQGKVTYDLSVSPIGAIRLEIFESGTGYQTTLYINPQKLDSVKNISDIVSNFNKELKKRSESDDKLKSLNLTLSVENFKRNIDTDSSVTVNAIAPLLSAATTTEVFKNGNIRFTTRPDNINRAYKQAGGRTKAQEATETKPALIVNRTEEKFSLIPSLSEISKKAIRTFVKSLLNENQLGQGYRLIAENDPIGFIEFVAQQAQNYQEGWVKNTNSDSSAAAMEAFDDIAEFAIGVFPAPASNLFEQLEQGTPGGIENIDNIMAQEALNPQPNIISGGIFGGFQQMNVDDQGNPIEFDVNDVGSMIDDEYQNQEEFEAQVFTSAREALNSVNIDFQNDPSGEVTYYDTTKNTVLDSLRGVPPLEVAKSMGFIIDNPKKDNKEDFQFKLGENGTKELDRMISIEQAKANIDAILPDFIKVEDINTVLDNISVKGELFGAFKNGIIYLNKQTVSGTEYHEAFHAVFRTLLTDEQIDRYLKQAQSQLYTQLSKQGKSINQLLAEKRAMGVYIGLSPSEAYERLYEEFMADRFQEYKQKKDSAGVFEKLFDLIKKFFKWLTRHNTDLDALFEKIDTGKFKYSNIAANRFTTDETDEFMEPEFAFSLVPARPGKLEVAKRNISVKRNLDAKTSKQVIQSVAAYYNLYKHLDTFKSISDDRLLNIILDDLKALYSIDNPLYAGYSDEQMNKLISSDESYIYSNDESRGVIKEGVQQYINSIRYIEQFREEEKEDDEQDTGSPSTGYDNSSENIGGISSLPGLLRQYIGFTTFERTDSFGNKQLIDGVPMIGTVDSIHVYYGLLRALANINDPVRFFQKMILFADDNEQTRYFVDKFVKDTGFNVQVLMEEGRLEADKNKTLVELVKKGFNKFRIDYLFTEHDITKASIKSYQANRKNVENIQFDKWANNFISGYSEYTEDSQKKNRQGVQDASNKYFDERRTIKFTTQKLNEATSEIQSTLRGLGIYLSKAYIKYSLLSNNAAKFDKANDGYKKEGLELQFDDPNNKFITKQDYDFVQIMKIGTEITLNKEFMDELSKILAAGANPFFKDIKTSSYIDEESNETVVTEDEVDTAMVSRILNVAKGNALFDESVGESSYTNAENKIVYAHQDGTFDVKFSYLLRDANYRKQLRELGYREGITSYRDVYDSEWLTNNYLLNSFEFEAIADNLLFQRIDGMRAVETNKLGKIITREFRDQKEGTTYGHYSSREFLVNLMNLYVSYSKEQRTSQGSIMTAPHLIRVLEASKTADTVNLPINTDVFKNGTITAKAVDRLYSEFEKEFGRIQRVQIEVGNLKTNLVENYHTGALGEDGFTVIKGYRGLKFTDNITSLLHKSTSDIMERKARTNESLTVDDIQRIKSDIVDNVNKIVDDTITIMDREGIVSRDGNKVLNVLLHRDLFVGNQQINLGGKFVDNLGHILVNDYINTLSYNQILHGDSALSLKNDGGIDAVKRAKGDNAAIVSMRTDLTDSSLGINEPFTHSSIAIFKEPVVDGIKIADAQMYTTVNGLRYTLWGLGRLTPRLARVLDALENNEDIHNLQDADDHYYDAVFDSENGLIKWDEMTNSLKLVYKDGKSYFKMSVVVLQPSLTSYEKRGQMVARPNWETLHNLRVKMETSGIHFAAPESASKMMTMDVSKSKDFSDLTGHLYDNNYFGLQTENPSNKLDITTPTQLLQLIDSEQKDEEIANFSGQDITVGKLKELYQDFVSQRVSNAYEVARNEMFNFPEIKEDLADAIKSGKIKPNLAKFQQRVLDTLEATGADAQLLDFFSLDDNGAPKFNLNMSATKTKFGQMFLAYFSKGVTSQKNPGYTIALMSAIDTKAIKQATRLDDKGRVIEWKVIRRELFDTNYNNIQNEQILSSATEVTGLDQYFLDELRHNVPERDEDGKIIPGRYFSEIMLPAHYKDFLSIPRDEDLPKAITDGFGVRIPSLDKHSFISTRIVDFLPANLGSTGVFPKELVKLSGADFDIDKLYLSRYDFYSVKDARGNIKFKKYGDAQTIEERWEEYKNWMSRNNKSVKSIVQELSKQDSDYQKFIKQDRDIIKILDELDDSGINATQTLTKKYKDKFITSAFTQLGLPSDIEEFEKVSKTRELNNGVVNNRIIDTYIGLLTNAGMTEIAATPSSLTAMEKIQFNEDITLRDRDGNSLGSVFTKKTIYPVDTIVGKYYAFKNNTTGKDNIGLDVVANLTYSLMNKGKIKLLEDAEAFEFDNNFFNSFDGDREYNPITKLYDGQRTADVLSTRTASSTDEAKEQLNALYNLGQDAVKVVDYLITLKVPLKTAIYFVNQPIIRNYLEIKAVKRNTLQTSKEDKLFSSIFQEKAVDKLKSDIKDYSEYTDDEMFDLFEREGLLKVEC